MAGTDLWERVLDAGNLRRARHQGRRHQGAPGLDGMTVDDLGGYLTTHWPTLRAALLAGPYVPQPVRRTAIPKAGGGTRNVGSPTGLDRCIEPARLQVLQEEGEPTCSESSDGFRPQHRADQAVGPAQAEIRAGSTGVVDIALERCVDQGHHDVLLSRVRRWVTARRGLTVIHRFLKAGGLPLAGSVAPTAAGPPHGGPRVPLRANLLLDEFDQELAKRGHRFARYADDANLYGRSRQAGEGGRASGPRVLERTLRLKVNAAQSAVDRPWNRTCLGFTFTRRPPNRRQGRASTGRTRGRTIRQIVQELRQRMRGWRAFVGVAEVRAPLRHLDTWIRRWRRRYHGTPGGRKRSRALRTRGVGRQLAWNTVKSAHGPWRLRQSPALAIALAQRYFATLGLPSLREG